MTGEEFTRLVTKQMLDKMEYYRSILREVVRAYEGDPCDLSLMEVIEKIRAELSVNPEWEVLEHVPRPKFPWDDPNATKVVQYGPYENKTDDPSRT